MLMSSLPMPVAEVLAQRVADRTGRRVRNLVVEIADDGDSVILRGRTNSFHVKQLAQQGVREALPNAEVENSIVVE